MLTLDAAVRYLDERLRTEQVPDYDRALNGLQFAHRGVITKAAAAVDFSTAAITGAARAGAQLLVVHHGMYWGGLRAITGARFEQISALIENNLAVYASHLPLDVHEELGNNVLLARTLGLVPNDGFGRFEGIAIGVSGVAEVLTAALAARAREFARRHGGDVVVAGAGEGRLTRRWGLCTGAGADSVTLREAATRGLDTLIVGEGPHHTAVEARELGIAIIYAGHYATETLGVQAVVKDLERQFGIGSVFIDAPTGL